MSTVESWNCAPFCISMWIYRSLFFFFNFLGAITFFLGIVFKPGPFQGSGSGFWPGHLITWVNPYVKKNQNIILVKKKKVNGLQPGFAGSTCWVCCVLSDHDFFYFFFSPAWFQSWVLGWPVGWGFKIIFLDQIQGQLNQI